MDSATRNWSTRHYIELDFFSGAPNPRWELTDAEVNEVMSQLARLERRSKPARVREPNSWYGGVILHVADPRGPGRYLTLFNERIFDSADDAILIDAGRTVERLLYERAPEFAVHLVDKMTFEQAAMVHHEVETIGGVESGEVARCPEAPAFELPPPPVRWNIDPGRHDNNCYNYANDVFSEIDDALPGGVLKHQWTERELHDLVTSDGLVPVNAKDNKRLPKVCAVNRDAHLVAICLRRRDGTRLEGGVSVPNFRDFHCFRLDKGGTWSHKDGRKKTSRTDNRNKLLKDLATAAFKLKHVLVGYYWTFPGPHRKIRMP